VLTQAAQQEGPLRVSRPLIVIVEPLASIALGIWLFGEHFEGSGWKTACRSGLMKRCRLVTR
jgi:hypothetical protein